MSESSADKPSRRQRYKGKNPRRFDQKYKELDADRYVGDISKIISQGKTPAGSHRPIMVQEILNVLRPVPGETVVDCTLGHGGHASHLLPAIQPGGLLIGLDADPVELPKTELRLRRLDCSMQSLVVMHTNFAGLSYALALHAPERADVVLADLGLSSMQIDDPARGFSYKHDGPLDMRMNPGKGLSAAEWIGRMDLASLANVLTENADEPQAEQLAQAILQAHSRRPSTTTLDLVAVIRSTMSRNSEATTNATVQRVFQAIRIAVNDEFGALDALLRQLPSSLKSGGRVAILSFHSGEDRRVKLAFKSGHACGVYSEIAPEVVRTSFAEQHANPRSASAKLRWAIRS